jgi:hypothetical protein
VIREAGPTMRADQLGNSARCLAALERDLDDADAMYREARALSIATGAESVAIEQAGAYLAAHAGRFVEARAMFERGLFLAREKEDRWSEFEGLRALVQLELEAASVEKALTRSSELLEVAVKMGDGSELAVARSLHALARASRGDEAAESLLDEALAGLRGADVKGILAYVLSCAAERDVENGRVDIAEQRAREALRAAETVSRRSQAAIARAILARVALARGDAAAAQAHIDDLPSEAGLSARARAALARLRSDRNG